MRCVFLAAVFALAASMYSLARDGREAAGHSPHFHYARSMGLPNEPAIGRCWAHIHPIIKRWRRKSPRIPTIPIEP